MKFNKLFITLCTVFLALASVSCGKTKTLSKAELVGKVKYGIVEITCGNERGSGVIIASDDKTVILTNYHVIPMLGNIKVRFCGESVRKEATLLGYEKYYDIAVLEVDYKPAKVHVFELESHIAAGQDVLAVGYTESQLAVFDGIISTPEKLITYTDSQSQSKNLFVTQTTTAFEAGCSGGALIDSSGKLLGLTTFILNFSAIGYSVPVEIISAIYERVLKFGYQNIFCPFVIGVDFTVTVTLSSGNNFEMIMAPEGLKVTRTIAQNCTVSKGDIITRINDFTVGDSITEVLAAIYKNAANIVFYT